MRSFRFGSICVSVLSFLLAGTGSAFGSLIATSTISSVPNGPNFDYTIKLTNTGTSDIGTFWFAWTPPGDPVEYDFLQTAPSAIVEPTGWIVGPFAGFPGYSIEYYNSTGSAISSGQTATFGFTSSVTPAAIQANDFFFHAFPTADSFIYAGAPLVGAFAQANPVFLVPEPSSALLAAIGFAIVSRRRRRVAAI